ncbi:hypothetical protein [Citrobacter sp. CK205]|uniref:hypothetical protein n=1 Tax=Citrobacter sp. CK205 TaxID=2985114 RepID=UPI002575FD63|nr:hypothetical protein [Citrobacter sp. CK205]MDM3131964.1 hypothetical protein [Citrobacter sp. CK205]
MTTITREQLIKRAQARLELMQEVAREFSERPNAQMDFRLAEIALASLDADSNNHPAHGPLSDYRLHRIREILGKAAAQSDGGNIGYAMSDAVKAIDELLAGRKAEPVAWEWFYYKQWHVTNDEERARDVAWGGVDVVPLYRHAPPAPAVPAILPCAVELKPGIIIGKGCKTETLLTALQRRADYYAEIDAMTPEERAEHDANIEAFKAMLPRPDIEMLSPALRNAPLAPSDSQGRPRAPVVPDEMTPQQASRSYGGEVRGYRDGWNACRAAMLNGGKS